MKPLILAVLLFIYPSVAQAAMLRPLADAAVGQSFIDKGYLMLFSLEDQKKPSYGVLVWGDSGWQVLAATLAQGVDPKEFLGKEVTLTATIQKDKQGKRQILIKKIE